MTHLNRRILRSVLRTLVIASFTVVAATVSASDDFTEAFLIIVRLGVQSSGGSGITTEVKRSMINLYPPGGAAPTTIPPPVVPWPLCYASVGCPL